MDNNDSTNKNNITYNSWKWYKEKVLNVDLLNKYIEDVRNIKKLDREMIDNINKMSCEDKMKIIITFNETIETIHNIIIDSL